MFCYSQHGVKQSDLPAVGTDLLPTRVSAPCNRVGPGRNRKLHTCDQCSYQTFHLCHMRSHKMVHTGAFFQCELCPRHFSNKTQLQYHLKAHFGLLRCPVCDKQYSSNEGLAYHRRTVHKKKQTELVS